MPLDSSGESFLAVPKDCLTPFSLSGCRGSQVFANGAKSKAILKNPITVCNSLIYVVDTVLLPTTSKKLIPVPTILEFQSLIVSYGK